MPSRAGKEKESDSDDGEGIATDKEEGKKKGTFETERLTLHYAWEVGNMVGGVLSRKAHHASICKQSVLC